jgi:hypothetical protein
VATAVPEPSTFTLAVLGALIVAGGWSRHRKARATGVAVAVGRGWASEALM